MKVLFVSLGCDKNLVDSEYMLGILRDAGYEFTDDEDEAEESDDSGQDSMFQELKERSAIAL